MRTSFKPIILAALFCCIISATGHAQDTSYSRDTTTTPAPSVEPDNTGINVRDRNESELTADQQKEDESDRSITQQIRKALMHDKALSTYAKNIKIISLNGDVTLKGPVRS